MSERKKLASEYQIIDPSKYAEILRADPLWYLPNSSVGKLIEEAGFSGINAEKPANWSPKTWEVFRMIHEARGEERLLIGAQFSEDFNDDDRWCLQNWDLQMNLGINRFTGEENPKVEKPHPDTVVIHHTNTEPGFSLEFFNTLAMLRLYVPLAIGGFPVYDGNNYPLNSGHYDKKGNMIFHGYHYYIRQNGLIEKTLREDQTGFHAGNYGVNIRATGIVLDGDFTYKVPSDLQLEAVKSLVRSLNPVQILAHQEIELKGEKVAHNCPGGKWEDWKGRLID